MRKAREAFQRAIESANRQKLRDNEAATILEETTDGLLLGYRVPVSERVGQALNIASGRHMRVVSALLLALAGEEQRAQALSDGVVKEAPEFEILKFLQVPTLEARIALNHHTPQKAIDLLKPAAAYDGRMHFTLFLRGLIGDGSNHQARVIRGH